MGLVIWKKKKKKQFFSDRVFFAKKKKKKNKCSFFEKNVFFFFFFFLNSYGININTQGETTLLWDLFSIYDTVSNYFTSLLLI